MTRNLLATISLLALVAFVTLGAVTAGFGTVGADGPSGDADRTIGVSATGEASAQPDQAVVQVAATATGDDPAAVRNDLAAGADALRSALDDLGVSYETATYSIDEPRRHREERSDQPAYRGVHAFEVTLDDPDAAGSVVDAAADAGATVQHLELTLSDARREQLRDGAITNAMTDARQQASTIAAAGDLRVVDTFSVDASQRHYRTASYDGAAAEAQAGGSTTIDAGDVSVSYQVQVTYNATSA